MRYAGRVLISLLMAGSAYAVQTPIRYRNQDPVLTSTVLRVCNPISCSPYSSTCGPLQICEMTAELPPGSYPVWLQASEAGVTWSGISNLVPFTIPSTRACDFDYDRSGSVSVLDFGVFLRYFVAGYVTTTDFGQFLTVFGKRC
jgi:hypothetical protein